MADVKTTDQTNVTPQDDTKPEETPKGAETPKTSDEPKPKTEDEIRAELKKEYEAMIDKRVSDAVKKRDKAWEEKNAKAKMSEEERKAAEERERLEAQAKKDHELTIKGLRLDVVDAVAELGLDASFRKLITVEDLADISDEDERKDRLTQRIKDTKALFDEAVAKEVEKAKADFLKGQTPPANNKNKENTDKYSQYKKAGNVKGMVGAKLAKLHSGDTE